MKQRVYRLYRQVKNSSNDRGYIYKPHVTKEEQIHKDTVNVSSYIIIIFKIFSLARLAHNHTSGMIYVLK